MSPPPDPLRSNISGTNPPTPPLPCHSFYLISFLLKIFLLQDGEYFYQKRVVHSITKFLRFIPSPSCVEIEKEAPHSIGESIRPSRRAVVGQVIRPCSYSQEDNTNEGFHTCYSPC